MKYNESLEAKGTVEIVVNWKNGSQETIQQSNTVLRSGRRALVRSLANDLNESFDFYINRMLFGNGGTTGGVKKFVDSGRTGLFGLTVLTKPVIATVDNQTPTQVIFTSVISFDEAVDFTLNEMALEMANGDLYSMTTSADLVKTSDMQITYNWRINFI